MLLQGTGNCWMVAAFYLNRNRIAETLCVNRFDRIPVCRGACFLERKLNENERRQEKSPDIKYKELTLFFLHVTDMQKEYFPAENPCSYCGYKSSHFPHPHIPQVFKPPIPLT
jgi:hypothetical protein